MKRARPANHSVKEIDECIYSYKQNIMIDVTSASVIDLMLCPQLGGGSSTGRSESQPGRPGAMERPALATRRLPPQHTLSPGCGRGCQRCCQGLFSVLEVSEIALA